MLAFTGRNRFISMESLWRHFKNAKTTRDAPFMPVHLSIHIKNISIHLVTQPPFKRTRIEEANGNRPSTQSLVSEEW
jgi:hypothetical protein